MKIKLLITDKTEEEIREKLESGDFKFVSSDEEYDAVLCSNHPTNALIGKIGTDLFILKPQDIIYIRADGNDCVCVTETNEYYIKEKIYQLESMFYEHKFLRISRSVVININMILSIAPTLNMKFKLKMQNNEIVEVTRSYYYIFKDFLGI